MKIGTIISDGEGPSTSRFKFVVAKESVVRAKKGRYVMTRKGDSKIIGYISEIFSTNRYYENPHSVMEYEKNGKMSESFPVDSWRTTIAEVRIFGSMENGMYRRGVSPPSPGDDVFEADRETLETFLGLDGNGVHLGQLQHHEIDVRLDHNKLLQKHLAILAMSGAGKSHCASVIMEELLEMKKEMGRIAIVLIDIHGEYIGFADDPNYKERVKVVDGKDIRFSIRSVGDGVLHLEPKMNSMPVKSAVSRVVEKIRKEGDRVGVGEFCNLLYGEGLEKKSASVLDRFVSRIKACRLFGKGDRPVMKRELKPGRMIIIDLSGIDDVKRRQLIVHFLAKKMFRLRKKGKIPPFLLVLEEAHNFASDAGKEEDSSRAIIEKIAREGRKFGACLCLISQRPVNLSTTALSQCNTQIILRVTNPNDLDHIGKSAEGIDARMQQAITSLGVGEAIVVGEAVRHPIFVQVRRRKSLKKERYKSLSEQAREFEEMEEKREKEVEAFM